jgi:hypothetical protein
MAGMTIWSAGIRLLEILLGRSLISPSISGCPAGLFTDVFTGYCGQQKRLSIDNLYIKNFAE